jgi:hypothetical protein
MKKEGHNYSKIMSNHESDFNLKSSLNNLGKYSDFYQLALPSHHTIDSDFLMRFNGNYSCRHSSGIAPDSLLISQRDNPRIGANLTIKS